MNNTPMQAGLSACLLTSHLWGQLLDAISTGAQLVATVSGAIIGVMTVCRMWRRYRQGRA